MAKKPKKFTPKIVTSFWGSKSVSLFQEEMKDVTSVLGRDKELKVKFEGAQVKFEDSGVTFPELPPTTELNHGTLMFMRGVVDNQAAKVRFSDKPFYNRKMNEVKKDKKLLGDIFASVEDVRVENEYNAAYPGAKKNLSEFSDEVISNFLKRTKPPKADWWQKGDWSDYGDDDEVQEEAGSFAKNVPLGLLAAGRKSMDYYSWQASGFLKDFKTSELDKIYDWSDEIFECQDTQDSFKLAEKIYEDLVDNHDHKDQQTPEEEQKTGLSFSLDQLQMAVNEIVQAIKDKEVNTAYGSQQAIKVYHWSDVDNTVIKQSQDLNIYSRVRDSLSHTINIARRKLELLIQAQRRIEWDFQKEAGKINSKMLCQAYQGNPFSFKIKQNAPDMDTAISVLVDMSSSMHGPRSNAAFETSVVLFDCFTKIGIPFELLGFNESGHHNIFVFKSFKDRAFDVRKFLPGLRRLVAGGTPAGQALLVTNNRLVVRPEKRKIMFVLTDGQPDNMEYSLEVIKKAEARGIDVVGVGIQIDVSKMFKNSIMVKNPQDLATNILKVLSDLLLHDGRAAA